MTTEIVTALEAALTGLECGASEDAQETAFVACWNALATLGRRGERIELVGTPDGSHARP